MPFDCSSSCSLLFYYFYQSLNDCHVNYYKFTVFSTGSFCQIYRVTDQALIAETAVWPNFFLMNIFFALKGSKLFIIRLNEMTEEDKEKLQTRIVDRDSDDYPKDALHLFADNQFVNDHNNNVLSKMPGEKVVIPIHDSVVSANIHTKECQNLINKLSDDYTKRAV